MIDARLWLEALLWLIPIVAMIVLMCWAAELFAHVEARLQRWANSICCGMSDKDY